MRLIFKKVKETLVETVPVVSDYKLVNQDTVLPTHLVTRDKNNGKLNYERVQQSCILH